MSSLDQSPRTSVLTPAPLVSASRDASVAAAHDDEADPPTSAKLPLLNVQLPSTSINNNNDDDDDDRTSEPSSSKLSATPAKRKAQRSSTQSSPVRASASPIMRRPSAVRRWIASDSCSNFLVVTVAVVGAAYIILSLAQDNLVVRKSYSSLFAPSFDAVPSVWQFVALMVVTMTVMLAWGLLDNDSKRTKRKRAFIVCGIYVVLLVIGNAVDLSATATRRASERTFATRFNAIYCDVRTLRLCLEDDPKAFLGLTGADATAALPSHSDKDQTLCPMLMARAVSPVMIGGSSNAKLRGAHMVKGEDVLKTDGKALNALLDDCERSVAIDKWCADALTRKTPMTDAEQLALPSPFASNPGVFANYVSGQAFFMLLTNVMLGTIALCFLLAGVGYDLAAKDGL